MTIETARAQHLYEQPFEPFRPHVTPSGPDSPATLRIATASEYAAAQLGAIARAAEKIEQHLAKIAAQRPNQDQNAQGETIRPPVFG